ncbi:hypothetical protein IscW_ISCW005426 [Ixodes scapularis]|uniref:Uncharacterized protein n=1 Tax=Ixodes scapularis TaxID=6945 RepID=B7PP71_IXOSC|nr:hypothetical protein IscW_ISCW005426 [Ixodes scapularis]|eukprot:XP_002435563.1 hypothetical protein IscW_ISCW005426 [Ixodes scapularis]
MTDTSAVFTFSKDRSFGEKFFVTLRTIFSPIGTFYRSLLPQCIQMMYFVVSLILYGLPRHKKCRSRLADIRIQQTLFIFIHSCQFTVDICRYAGCLHTSQPPEHTRKCSAEHAHLGTA